MTGTEIMAVVGFFVMLFGALFGIWKYIDGKLTATKDECSRRVDVAHAMAVHTQSQLSEYKTHVAETYATKAGMQEQTAQLLRAIESVASRIDGLHERLDRAFERPVTRRST